MDPLSGSFPIYFGSLSQSWNYFYTHDRRYFHFQTDSALPPNKKRKKKIFCKSLILFALILPGEREGVCSSSLCSRFLVPAQNRLVEIHLENLIIINLLGNIFKNLNSFALKLPTHTHILISKLHTHLVGLEPPTHFS